jgi:hypothetical protein
VRRGDKKNGKRKSARYGRFFFFAPPCMVEENFTGKLLENASPLPFTSCSTFDKPLIN